MKITIHPLFLLLLLSIILYGDIALYSVIIASLLFHELGHYIAAKMVGADIEQCKIVPYGGEMTIKNEMLLSYNQLIIIALGGPLATCIGIFASVPLPDLLSSRLIEVQLFILAINLLPIWPLDGGRIFCYSLLKWRPFSKIFEFYLTASFYLLTVIIIVLLYLLPHSLSLAIISLFLWSKVIGDWRARKYRSAFEKIVMNRLT
ncbi:metalloprotease [Solibacillus silvestris]|uniref:metalloprotease n=1 Tax=Solibacillus silvestris TaxID=76853 RepID=UPI003F7D6EE2